MGVCEVERGRAIPSRRTSVVMIATLLGGVIGPPGLWMSSRCYAAAPSGPDALGLKKFEEGLKAFEGGQFETALLAFQQSLERLPSPNTRLYIARCYRALGRVGTAYTTFRLASSEAQDRLTATNERRYKATRDAASSEAAEIEGKVPRLTIAVPAGVPTGFMVQVDGKDMPSSAWGAALEIDPGEHEVTASGPRLQPFKSTFRISEGEGKRIEVKADRLPTATIALKFAVRPSGLAVEVDGKPLDPSQVDRLREVDIGLHRMTARAPGYRPFHWQKALIDGDKIEVRVRLDPEVSKAGGTPPWLLYAAGGAAVVSLGVGTYFALHARSMNNEEISKDPLVRDEAAQDRVRSSAVSATALFIAGGVLAAGAGVLGFTTRWPEAPRKDDTGSVRPTVWAGLQAGGFGFGGCY